MTAPFFPGIRPHIDGFYATDFSGYATGAQPFDWEKTGTGFTATVEAVAAAHSGKALRWSPASDVDQMMRWMELPQVSDFEVLMQLRRTSNGSDGDNYPSVVGRAASLADLYYQRFMRGASGDDLRSQVFRRVGGVSTSLTGNTDMSPCDPSSGQWWWMRVRIVGTTLSRKAWEDNESEPVSFNTVTDATIAGPGFVALLCDEDSLPTEMSYFAFAAADANGNVATIPQPWT